MIPASKILRGELLSDIQETGRRVVDSVYDSRCDARLGPLYMWHPNNIFMTFHSLLYSNKHRRFKRCRYDRMLLLAGDWRLERDFRACPFVLCLCPRCGQAAILYAQDTSLFFAAPEVRTAFYRNILNAFYIVRYEDERSSPSDRSGSAGFYKVLYYKYRRPTFASRQVDFNGAPGDVKYLTQCYAELDEDRGMARRIDEGYQFRSGREGRLRGISPNTEENKRFHKRYWDWRDRVEIEDPEAFERSRKSFREGKSTYDVFPRWGRREALTTVVTIYSGRYQFVRNISPRRLEERGEALDDMMRATPRGPQATVRMSVKELREMTGKAGAAPSVGKCLGNLAAKVGTKASVAVGITAGVAATSAAAGATAGLISELSNLTSRGAGKIKGLASKAAEAAELEKLKDSAASKYSEVKTVIE